MKRFLLLITVCFICAQLNAQCIANAGEYKHSCDTDSDANGVSIGGMPTASGGIAPYTYCWSTDTFHVYPGSSLVFTASDILNDTTVANPLVIDRYMADTVVFYLKITDANGCVSYDTCKVSFSNFTYSLWNVDIYIDEGFVNRGDSVYLDEGVNIDGSSYTPYSYSWQPAYGISTTTLATGFWALPSTTTIYSVTLTDAVGCQSAANIVYYFGVCPTGYTVDANAIDYPCFPTGIKENFADKIDFSVYPNPVNKSVNITCDKANEMLELKITDISGRVLMQMPMKENKKEVDMSSLASGIYFFRVYQNNQHIKTEKVIKE